LKLNENPPTEDNEITFTDDDWKVLSIVDGKKTLKEIARELAISEFETGRIVYNLISAGFIILGEEKEDKQDDEPDDAENEPENKSNEAGSETNDARLKYSSRKKKKKGGLFGGRF